MASLLRNSRLASLIFVLFALSIAISAPAAHSHSAGEAVLHSFDLTDGKAPTSGIIQGTDGNFYGTTANGGANYPFASGAGTVFQLTPSGTLTTLYSFCSVVDPATGDCLDGDEPFASLIQGSDGNLYGTTGFGGANGDGTVFEVDTTGPLRQSK